MKLSEIKQRAIQHQQAGEYEPARRFYAQYLFAVPGDYSIWSNLGALFRSEGRFELAVAAHNRALELNPDAPQILANASNSYFDVGEVDRAVELRGRLLEIEKDDPNHHAMHAKYLRGARKYAKAERLMKKAVKQWPEDSELHIQMAMAQLSQGDYPNGFETFEWRWQGDEISLPKFDFPRWQGEDLNGKHLLVTPEQGFGDTVLMARFIEQIAAMGATVHLACKKPLQRLFAQLPGLSSLAVAKDDLDKMDYWTPMMDLPRYLNTVIEDLPAPAQLHTPEDSVSRAKAMVAPAKDRFKVGVLWSGSVTYRANHKRSFGHERFLELSDIPNLQMYSLYKGPLHEEFVKDGTSCIITDAAGSDRDFADSAAVIKEMDLVVSMDSAIVHVSGSLGVPVWNLLHSEAYWLYEPFPDATPWYPSMRLIRQKTAGGWDDVFKRLHKDISALAAKKKG